MAVRVELPQGFHIEEDFENVKIGIEMARVLAGYDMPVLYVKIPSEGIKITTRGISYGEVSNHPSATSEELYLKLKTELSEKTAKGSSQLVLKEGVKKIVLRLIKQYLSSCRISNTDYISRVVGQE